MEKFLEKKVSEQVRWRLAASASSNGGVDVQMLLLLVYVTERLQRGEIRGRDPPGVLQEISPQAPY